MKTLQSVLIILMTVVLSCFSDKSDVCQGEELYLEQGAKALSQIQETRYFNTKAEVKRQDGIEEELGTDRFCFDSGQIEQDKGTFSKAAPLAQRRKVRSGGERVVQIVSSQEWPACLSLEYRLNKAEKGFRYGLCWSQEHIPTLEDNYQYGPVESRDGVYFQTIPNMGLEYGREVRVRAFVKTCSGICYSEEKKMNLQKESPAIQLEWERISVAVPSSVQVYKTTTPLNGRVFNAWYAIADVSSDVELRVLDPHACKTVDDQFAAAGDCHVLVNGGFFYNGHIGITVRDYQLEGSIISNRGSLDKNDPEYNVTYCPTKGVFGVDGKGVAGVRWAATGEDDVVHYFDKPMPVVVGEGRYGKVSADYPCPEQVWNPKNAISAGPVLVYDGNVCFDFSTTSRSERNFICNYEIHAYDIFGTRSGTPDRTAIGCTADGKVILFVCDGRIRGSKGATLTELAQIMKGLGCVYALNLDGGGSTAMVAGGQHLNSLEVNTSGKIANRAVVSTVGFFRKR